MLRGSIPRPSTSHRTTPTHLTATPWSASTVPRGSEVDLSLHNLAGQRVVSLLQGYRDAETYSLRWDGRDDDERELASGVYLYRLQVGESAETRRLPLRRTKLSPTPYRV